MRFGSRIALVVLFIIIQGISSATSQQAREVHTPKWGATFQFQVKRCWNKPNGGASIQPPDIGFRVRLKQDGTLEGSPVAEEDAVTPDLRKYQDSAARAIVECQPY